MKNKVLMAIVIATAFVLTGGSQALAKGGGHKGHGASGGKSAGESPRGWSHGDKSGWEGSDKPPGYSHGEKSGWGDSEMPPGRSDKSEKGHKSKDHSDESGG